MASHGERFEAVRTIAEMTAYRWRLMTPKRALATVSVRTPDAPAASLEVGSPAHVFVQKGKHVGLPYAHAEMEKVVPLVHGVRRCGG